MFTFSCSCSLYLAVFVKNKEQPLTLLKFATSLAFQEGPSKLGGWILLYHWLEATSCCIRNAMAMEQSHDLC